MLINLCLESGKFRAFRSEDIRSIEPSWYAEDCFECYHVQLIDRSKPLELTEQQGIRLLKMLDYKTICSAE